MVKFFIKIIFILSFSWCAFLDAHQHTPDEVINQCKPQNVSCAKTVTIATHPNGDIWRVWASENQMFYAISDDKGESFNKAVKVQSINEQISSRGENRPKVAFSQNGHVYLSWAKPGAKKYTGDIRFSFSNDDGISFTNPVTVNNDKLITGHSFNEMIVTNENKLILVWLDSRDKYKAKKAGKVFNGASIYLAQAQFGENKLVSFSNEKITQGTCVCCRLTLLQSDVNQVSIMYRDIFGDNIRDFSLANYDLSLKKVINNDRVTFDEWFINGCPHQGAGISKSDQRLHLTWFNQGSKGKGIFYAFTDNLGKKLSTPISIGDFSRQAVHPNLLTSNSQVDIVWLEFNGSEHELWHQQSLDKGVNFNQATKLMTSHSGADRPFLYTSNQGEIYVSWHRPNTGHWTVKL